MVNRKKLKLRLNLLFGLTAIIVLLSCALVYWSYEVQSSYSSKISLSTRQKAIAEELARKMLMLHDKAQNTSDLTVDVQEITLILTKWQNTQKALLAGSDYYGTSMQNSVDVQELIQQNANPFVKSKDFIEIFLKDPKAISREELKTSLLSIDEYVEGINNITGIFLSESQLYSKLALSAFGLIAAAALVFLIGGIFLVIRPVRRAFDSTETELETMEEKIASAENTKTEFLSNMSHEVRTPLNGVIGMSELLQQTQLNEEQRSYARNIHISANNLLELLNNVLDVSKLQSGKLELHKERFVLSDCVDQVIDLMKPLAYAKKLELMSDLSTDLPMEIIQDETRLRQVLINLVNNAIKFTERGEVHVHAETVNREGDFVQIKFSVRDTGIGIEPSVTDKLFQSFYQVDSSSNKKYGGSGLGLSICKNLVQEMGGRIWVESKPGQGSTFSFTLVGEASSASQNAKIEALNGLRALVVDDNKTNLKILVKQLSAWGIQATPFNSPDLVTEIVASLHKFDFVIMDMQMPEMDGKALTEKIRTQYSFSELPIIVLSSLGEHLIADKENLYNAFLTKPVKQSRLLDSIIEVMRISPVQRAKQRMMTGNFEVGPAHSKLKILVAQDNELSRAVTAKTLELLGHRFDLANSSREVLDRSRRDEYDLILMDVKTEHVDGIETTRQLKKIVGRNAMPVIFGLTDNERKDKQPCIQAGMDDIVEKPMKPEVLQEKIHFWLESE